MTDAEYLLLFVRGRMCGAQAERNQWVSYRAPIEKHSTKPALFRELIERRFPHRKRIELFARDTPDGWDVWGDAVDGIELEAV